VLGPSALVVGGCLEVLLACVRCTDVQVAVLALGLLTGFAALHGSLANLNAEAGVRVLHALMRALCFYLCRPPPGESLLVDTVHALHGWMMTVPSPRSATYALFW
jgi:hypothetical protein